MTPGHVQRTWKAYHASGATVVNVTTCPAPTCQGNGSQERAGGRADKQVIMMLKVNVATLNGTAWRKRKPSAPTRSRYGDVRHSHGLLGHVWHLQKVAPYPHTAHQQTA